ncbi:hypothetical protein [Longimicrobium sp.]|uniref:hypothetical protein n=1 Tax=Longimicrobium sp. TaxID=2029185 RepID=UPI002C98B7ED|nr:hypothetical protein [Longimicrobium sp.]HSU14465.1 hypothetical protein [Longimicrobium sp.]
MMRRLPLVLLLCVTSFANSSKGGAQQRNRQQQQQQQNGSGSSSSGDCAPRTDADVVQLCHWDLRRRHTTALYPKETLRVTVLDANPLIYSYDLTGEQFVEDQSARDAFRTLFALRSAAPAQVQHPTLAAAREARETCEARRGDPTADFTCFAGGIESAAELLLALIRETDLFNGTTAEEGREVTNSIRETLRGVENPIRPFLASDAALIAELDARFQAITSPTPDQQARYKAVRDAAGGVVRFWHELERLYLGPITRVYNYNSGTDELIRLRIQNRLGDAYTPLRPTSTEGIALAVIKPVAHGFEFSTGLAFVFGDRANFSVSKLTGDTLRVQADTVHDLSVPPSLFLSYLWHPGGTVTLGPTFGVGVKDLSQIENSTDLLGGITIGLEWFRLTFGGAYASEISAIPGLDSQNRTTDPNVLSRATRQRVLHPFFAVHGHF